MAKGIVKKTEKAAKKQLRQEGAFKGLSRKERIALSKKKASEARNWVRGQMAEGRKAKAVKKSASDAKKREEARASGNTLSYDRFDKSNPNYQKGRYEGTAKEVMGKVKGTSGGFGSVDNTPGSISMKEAQTNRRALAAAKPGDTYEITRPDGSKKTVRKPIAKHGASVKAVKKAKSGASTDPTKKEGIKAKDIKETLKTAFIPGYAIKKGYDYLKGKASTNQKAIDDARNKKATEMQKKKLEEMREDRSKRADWSGKYKEELVKATKESGAETAQEVALKKVVSGPKPAKKAMMKTRGKLAIKKDKKIVLPKKKQITKLEEGGKVSEYGRKHDRLRNKGFKLRAKSEDKFLSTIGNNSKAENMSQKKKERLRRKSDKLDERSMSKFYKAKAIRRNK